ILPEDLAGDSGAGPSDAIETPGELFVLFTEFAGKALAEFLEELPRIGEVILPVFRRYAQELAEGLGRDVQAIEGQRIARGHVTDRRFLSASPAFDALENPFQHAHIFAKTGP